MNYHQRITLAFLLSLLLNLLLVALPWPRSEHTTEAVRPPLVFTVPPEPERMRPNAIAQVVESVTPATPQSETALLSNLDSALRGESGAEPEAPSPLLDQLDDAFNLPKPAVAPSPEPLPPVPSAPPAEAQPPSPQAQEPLPESPLPPAPDEMREPENPVEDAAPEEASFEVARAAATPAPPAPEAEEEAALGRPVPPVPPADAPAPPPSPAAAAAPQAPEAGASDVAGVTVESGFASFSAVQDEVAAYVLYLKPLIRQEWVTLLVTRYKGNTPTTATVRLSITPEGQIAGLELLDDARDRFFATICKEAIRKAGPFKPFPFKVPPEYQDENLVVRWRFRFL